MIDRRSYNIKHEGDSDMIKKYEYDYVVFIGRMQPPHLAHIEIIWRALQQSKKVIVLFGSASTPRTIENPWTVGERSKMVQVCFDPKDHKRLFFAGIEDVGSNQQWASNVQDTVAKIINNDILNSPNSDNVIGAGTERIAIIGHKKDSTSFYLDMFPQWSFLEIENIDSIHATNIRKMMFEQESVQDESIPKSVQDYLKAFMNSNPFSILKQEYEFIQAYQQAWDWDKTLNAFLENEGKDLPDGTSVKEVIDCLRSNYTVAPYSPTFVTVDAVIVQSGHVLLVRRRSAPGRGLWAMPGGFIGRYERLEDAMLRELREETKLKVPEPVLRGNIKINKVFDNPLRSLRGRTITHAYGIELPPGPLPKVKGSDDAEKAKWVPLGVFEKMRDQMFEDHYLIINDVIEKM